MFILLTLAGWSSVPLFLKHFTGYFDAWTANGWRYLLSALVWLPVLIVQHARGTLLPGLWRASALPALFNTLGQVFFSLAFYYLDPGLMTFVFRAHIVFMMLGAYVLFPAERPLLRRPAYWAGLGAVLAGSVGTIFLGAAPPSGATAAGIVIVIISGVCFAAYWLGVRACLHDTHPVTGFAAISQYSAVGMVLLMLVFGERCGARGLELTASQFALVFTSSLAGIALGHVFYFAALNRLGVVVASGIVQLQPFAVTAASYAIFGERLTAAQWCSGGVAVAGAILMLRVRGRAEPAAASPANDPHPVDAGESLVPESALLETETEMQRTEDRGA